MLTWCGPWQSGATCGHGLLLRSHWTVLVHSNTGLQLPIRQPLPGQPGQLCLLLNMWREKTAQLTLLAAVALTQISVKSTHKNLTVHKIMWCIQCTQKKDSVSTRLKQNMEHTVRWYVKGNRNIIRKEHFISRNLKGAFWSAAFVSLFFHCYAFPNFCRQLLIHLCTVYISTQKVVWLLSVVSLHSLFTVLLGIHKAKMPFFGVVNYNPGQKSWYTWPFLTLSPFPPSPHTMLGHCAQSIPLKQHCMGGRPSLGKRAAFFIEQGAMMKTVNFQGAP